MTEQRFGALGARPVDESKRPPPEAQPPVVDQHVGKIRDALEAARAALEGVEGATIDHRVMLAAAQLIARRIK